MVPATLIDRRLTECFCRVSSAKAKTRCLPTETLGSVTDGLAPGLFALNDHNSVWVDQ